MGIGFLSPFLWIVTILGAAYFLHLAISEMGRKSLYIGSWLAWTIKVSIVVFWFWSTYPISWLPLEAAKSQILAIGITWVAAAITIGLCGPVVVSGVRLFRKLFADHKASAMFLLTPLIWVLAEIFGSFAYSVLAIGPGGYLNISFSFGYLGYVLAEHPLLLLLAKWGGVYILSAAGVLFALVLLHLSKTKQMAGYGIAMLVVVYLTSFVSVASPVIQATYETRISIIETKTDTATLRDQAGLHRVRENLGEAMVVALELDPAYVVLPEGSGFFNQKESLGSEKFQFQLRYNNPQTIVIDTEVITLPVGRVLQAYLYDSTTDQIEKVHKGYLVPQGEYLASLFVLLAKWFGYSAVIDAVKGDMGLVPGNLISQAELPSEFPSVLFCFESVNPLSVRRLTTERPDQPFVAHPISHAWFNEPESLWYQLDQMLRVQAVWNDTYIVSAGNFVSSKVYTPAGTIKTPTVVTAGDGWLVRETTIAIE